MSKLYIPAAAAPPRRLTLRRVAFWLVTALFLASLYAPAAAFYDDRYWLPLFSRWLALAVFALSVDLVWGYTGLLSLGQGLYFGVGCYLMAYYLNFQKAAAAARDGVPGQTRTEFMV